MKDYTREVERLAREIKDAAVRGEGHEASFSTNDERYSLFVRDLAEEYPDDFLSSTCFTIELNRNVDACAFTDKLDDANLRIVGELEETLERLLTLASESEASLLRLNNGTVFQMLTPIGEPTPFSESRENFSKCDFGLLNIGDFAYSSLPPVPENDDKETVVKRIV